MRKLEAAAVGAALSIFCSFIFLTAAYARADQAAAKSFDIGPQSLATALSEFARQSEQEILFAPDVVASKLSSGVRGTMPPLAALQVLLKDAALSFTTTPNGAILVGSPAQRPAGPRPSSDEVGGAQPGDRENGAQKRHSFWDRFRLAQVDQGNSTATAVATEADEQGSKKESLQLEEIVVTAQKREQRLIDVPLAVTALSAAELTKLGATQLRDYADTIPGFSFRTSGAGFSQISIRGITIAAFDSGPTVGIYVDEVPYGSSSIFANGSSLALDLGLFDLDRIEVLRGPQGTLYGAGAMGGILKYVTKLPSLSDGLRTGVQAGLSSTHEGGINYNGASALNIPLLEDKLAVRASGYYSHDDGYFDNARRGEEDVNRSDVYGGRLDVLFAPTGALSIRLGAFAQNISRDGTASANYALTGVPLADELSQLRGAREPFEQRYRLVSGVLTYDFGALQLISISGYQTLDTEIIFDSSNSVPGINTAFGRSYSAIGNFQDITTDKFSQEVRLASAVDTGAAFDWVIGGFYTDEKSKKIGEWKPFDLSDQPVPGPSDLVNFVAPSTYEAHAFFGNVTWHLTDKLDVSGGVRYAHNRQVYEQISSGRLLPTAARTTSDDGTYTYLGDVQYHFNDRVMIYGRCATGFRPGGPNFAVFNPATGGPLFPPTFEADELRSYELGFKGETADRRYGIDVSAYHLDWSNVLVSVNRSVVVNGAVLGPFQGQLNAPDGAQVRGIELALTARPIRNLTLAAALARMDAEMSEANANIGAAKGERLQTVPDFTGALNADYLFQGVPFLPTIGATVRHVSDRTFGFKTQTNIYYQFPSYTTVDLRTGMTLKNVDLQLYAHNLFDERAQLAGSSGAGPGASVTVQQPRTIGISVTTSF
jgi:iron complex outermembrane recepter protein